MKRSLVGVFLGLMVASLPLSASADALGKSMGNLRWGVSDVELLSIVKSGLAKEYGAKVKKARGSKKDQLKTEMKRRFSAFEDSLEELDGRSRYDSSPISEEYTHGNNEALMVLKGGDSDNYYFFIEGKLWKWVKVFPGGTFGGSSKFASTIKKRFGNGLSKSGTLSAISDSEYDYIEFRNRNTRMRAVDQGSRYSLIFEDLGTLRMLSALRSNTPSRKAKRSSRKSKSYASSSRSSSKPAPASSPQSSGKKRRSLFADEGRSESDAEYAARKKRVQEEEKRKARGVYERQMSKKRGKVLDELTGMDDDDPLSGVR
ncbi:MAG: hypothetical protein OEZ06_24975 [Myxococcales bacterium]|nr:hypothetical protein [Myxococcales bacterium]